MRLRSLHRSHRWIAIPTGVFIIGWIVTGVVALVPTPAPVPRAAQTLDLAQVAVTPAEAVRALAETGVGAPVRALRLQRLGDVLAYEISVVGRGPQLIDARTGRRVTVDEGLARSIAVARAPAGARLVRADLLSRRREDLMYRWGGLPAYRITFDDPWATVVYVVAEDGSLQTTTRWGRVLGAVAALHTFDPLDLVLRDPAIRKAILIAVSLTALVTAITGYAIVVSRQR
ncbi:MAG TPA: hypothetical protein VFV05_00275 [Methylomirabilota bacterium]|nr:hypothetical protein [Methylomirabilota bacterium]